MSLQSFIEAGGEAVVRGIAGTYGAADISSLTQGAEGVIQRIALRLDQKGYSRFGMSAAEIREVAVAVGRTIEAARVVQAGGRIADGAGGIPLFPGSPPSDRIAYTVVIDRNFGGSISSTVVDVFSGSGQLPLSQIIDKAVSSVEAVVRPNSPPPFDPNNNGRVTAARVISVYQGEPIGG